MERPYTRADFIRRALTEFPELREGFDLSEGLLSLQMHNFARLMQEAKGAGDWDRYGRGARLAAELWRRPDAELLRALETSFLENLDFDGPRGPMAWQQLTPELQEGWRAMRGYWDRLNALPPKTSKRKRQPRRGKRR